MNFQIALICLQIINILVASFAPIISNFIQSITISECCGLRIKRNIIGSPTDQQGIKNIIPPEVNETILHHHE